jgi:uncharacterized protein YcbX
MHAPHLTEIHIYPVKSLRGECPRSATVEPWGLAGDRRWLITDPTGAMLTQREIIAMARLQARPSGPAASNAITVTAPHHPPLHLPPPPATSPNRQVTIWRDTVPALDAGDEPAAWLSTALGTQCRLVHLADPRARPINPDYASPGQAVSFADGYPLLLTTEASFADLNTRLATPISMSRFRPNLVIHGTPAWSEDTWRRIRIGAAIFRVAKPCDRCIITTIDPATATRPNPVEPIRTLGTFRRDRRGGVMFGQNLIPEHCADIHVSDFLEVLEAGEPNVQLGTAADRRRHNH